MSKPTLLVAVDGSAPAEKAVTFAADAARKMEATLHVVTAIHIAVLEDDAEFAVSDEKVKALCERAKERNIAPLEQHFKGLDVVSTVLVGEPAQAILAQIEKTNPMMVVLGRTGKSALERMLEGSVSRKVSSLSTAPVCLVS